MKSIFAAGLLALSALTAQAASTPVEVQFTVVHGDRLPEPWVTLHMSDKGQPVQYSSLQTEPYIASTVAMSRSTWQQYKPLISNVEGTRVICTDKKCYMHTIAHEEYGVRFDAIVWPAPEGRLEVRLWVRVAEKGSLDLNAPLLLPGLSPAAVLKQNHNAEKFQQVYGEPRGHDLNMLKAAPARRLELQQTIITEPGKVVDLPLDGGHTTLLLKVDYSAKSATPEE